MKSKEIRQKWIDFFKSKDHLEVESKSLIPVNDPSLLWINSGVATLKDFFSGKKQPPKNRLVNSQKAIRTNDIENVGVTSRHHTFFEMLGNFSIGDYFKKEAVAFAYEFLLDVLKLDKNKLYITYFNEDTEVKKYWMDLGISESHLIAGDRDSNFWDVGMGPCGPCTEIYFDRGPRYHKKGIELIKKDIENDRFIEIWNIVFSQFNNDGENNYTELKQKNIDTGAGLERIASILQDAPTNYDSDLFQPIIKEIEKYTEFKYDIENYFSKNKKQREINTNFKIIADHIRTVANAIADGERASNVGRGYIIRRLIRRAIYKGMQLNIKGQFLSKLVKVVKKTLPFEYDVKEVENAIKEEEKLFHKTIEKGKLLLAKSIDKKTKIFDGNVAFNLLETYGFPIELTIEILKEQKIDVNLEQFEEAKQKHIEASRGKQEAGMSLVINSLTLIKNKCSEFTGYEKLDGTANVLFLLDNEKQVDSINGEAYLVLDKTPFYATSGGQHHDHGYMLQGNNRIEIVDVFKDKFGNHIHKVNGVINSKDKIECFVDKDIRLALARGHSATHITFSVLRNVLGHFVEQLGSDITAERFTFDYPAEQKLTDEQIKTIEDKFEKIIKNNVKREYIITTIEKAKQLNAIMTIEESEYMDPKHVRVVKWGDITTDLCGGTHLENSSQIERFKIVGNEKKQAGIFRLRVVTSKKAVENYYKDASSSHLEELNNIVNKIKTLDSEYNLRIEKDENYELYDKKLVNLIEQAKEDYKKVYKEKSVVTFDFDSIELSELKDKKVYINLNVDSSQIKVIASTIREKFSDAYVFVGAPIGNQILLAVATKNEDSNKIFQKLAKELNGRGGGSPILAMGKILNSNIREAIEKVL
ncbi:alanine--tRNA ligase [Mycoplasma sp. Mirounga ES2805-ORL]|uniref:alanine--tRNA ligase n=1 Tax=Mycoplasma sp. Mirounga ES2805-ORL TaxID=754514 RepID=UPI00197B4B50|nr:alanine--tRNA ligase [Mycoplasma sp. Mirounga ES2805-ORL]QSF13987.1 alanine--tRNA ligase [Mycoplasma sp. Mirounga ES2805-ORL]